MTIRYVRDGLRVVRVASAAPVPPSPDAPDGALREAAAVISAAAAHLRADVTRRQRLNPIPPHAGDDRGGWFGRRPRAEEERATGPELRQAREAVGLSQRTAAAELGYGRGVLASAELGYRTVPPRIARWVRQVLRTEGIT